MLDLSESVIPLGMSRLSAAARELPRRSIELNSALLDAGNPTVVAHFKMSCNYRGIYEFVGVLPVSVLLEHCLEEPLDVKVQPPECPEEDILARIPHRGPCCPADDAVSGVVPGLNCIRKIGQVA